MPADLKAPWSLHTRAAGPQDAPFLRALFESHCTHLHALGLPPAALQALVGQQYACRQADYGRRFPQAATLVAIAGPVPVPVGAMVVDDDGATLHIVDIAVAPSARGQGHGSALMRLVQAQAQGTRRQAVTLSVDPMNQNALRLYLALGFEATEKQPVQWRMRWRPLPCATHEGAHAAPLSLSPSTTMKG